MKSNLKPAQKSVQRRSKKQIPLGDISTEGVLSDIEQSFDTAVQNLQTQTFVSIDEVIGKIVEEVLTSHGVKADATENEEEKKFLTDLLSDNQVIVNRLKKIFKVD